MIKTREIIEWVRPMLPENKTRYTMGVGLNPQNLIDVVAEGIDIFDCVAPTRNARHGSLYHGKIVKTDDWVQFQVDENKGKIHIGKGKYATDNRPIMEGCECYTCQHFTRAYLRHLFKEKLLAYYNLACIHNLHIMHGVCRAMRDCIIY